VAGSAAASEPFTFRVSTFDAAPLPPNKTAAQFLIQATFGPSRATVAGMTAELEADPAGAIPAWVRDQMALTPSLHREYYRRRTNPRLDAPVGTGGVYLPCDVGSRWHRQAFTEHDVGHTLSATALPGGGFSQVFYEACTHHNDQQQKAYREHIGKDFSAYIAKKYH
jgi:hypothetical protein